MKWMDGILLIDTTLLRGEGEGKRVLGKEKIANENAL